MKCVVVLRPSGLTLPENPARVWPVMVGLEAWTIGVAVAGWTVASPWAVALAPPMSRSVIVVG